MKNIQMVNLTEQYQKIKPEVDEAIANILASAQFVKGPSVSSFESHLAKYLNAKHVVGCANGTDALQIALMALGLEQGDEVIVPAFTYVATAEVIGLLGLKPVMVDVDKDSFNTTAQLIENAITSRTKAIVPVHLFGQSADMEPILAIAKKHQLFVVEDNAQSLGATYTFSDGKKQKTGTLGDIGCTSFFPSKNLGCYGDGGALFTNNDDLAQKIKMIANHGQSKRYYHDIIGCNSRLDSIQAAVLDIKLKYFDQYNAARLKAANYYDAAFRGNPNLIVPRRSSFSTHVFHQYTLRILGGKRNQLHNFLKEKGVPTGIYYPLPLYKQKAYAKHFLGEVLENTETLCQSVLSLPIHTELDEVTQNYIIAAVREGLE